LDTWRTFATDSSVGVLAQSVGAESGLFDALVDVDAAVAVVRQPVALGTLTLVASRGVLAFAWKVFNRISIIREQ
jgi:hypothetical protein